MLVDARKSRVDVGGRDHLSSGEIQSSNLGKVQMDLRTWKLGKAKREMEFLLLHPRRHHQRFKFRLHMQM